MGLGLSLPKSFFIAADGEEVVVDDEQMSARLCA